MERFVTANQPASPAYRANRDSDVDVVHVEAAADNHCQPSRGSYRLRAEHDSAPHLDLQRAHRFRHRQPPSVHYEHGIFTTDTSTDVVSASDWRVVLELAFSHA